MKTLAKDAKAVSKSETHSPLTGITAVALGDAIASKKGPNISILEYRYVYHHMWHENMNQKTRLNHLICGDSLQ